jgi:hypothetical protein
VTARRTAIRFERYLKSGSGRAAHEGAQWEVRVPPLLRRGARKSAGQDRPHAVEQVLGDQPLEIAAPSTNAVLRHVHDAGAQLIAKQHTDRL